MHGTMYEHFLFVYFVVGCYHVVDGGDFFERFDCLLFVVGVGVVGGGLFDYLCVDFLFRCQFGCDD